MANSDVCCCCCSRLCWCCRLQILKPGSTLRRFHMDIYFICFVKCILLDFFFFLRKNESLTKQNKTNIIHLEMYVCMCCFLTASWEIAHILNCIWLVLFFFFSCLLPKLLNRLDFLDQTKIRTKTDERARCLNQKIGFSYNPLKTRTLIRENG